MVDALKRLFHIDEIVMGGGLLSVLVGGFSVVNFDDFFEDEIVFLFDCLLFDCIMGMEPR